MQPARIQVGVFPDYAAAEDAVTALLVAGVPREAISVVCPSCATPTPALDSVEHVEPAGTHAPGAAVGGSIGGVLGGLTAAVGVVASGGTGLLVVGPLLAGSVIGAFVGAMTTRGFEHEIAHHYDRALERGEVLVAVDTSVVGEPVAEGARRLLAAAGGETRALERD